MSFVCLEPFEQQVVVNAGIIPGLANCARMFLASRYIARILDRASAILGHAPLGCGARASAAEEVDAQEARVSSSEVTLQFYFWIGVLDKPHVEAWFGSRCLRKCDTSENQQREETR